MLKIRDGEELPVAMVNYLAARLSKVSKHARGHAGQKTAAKAHRRGTHGKAVRHRQLAARRAAIAARSSHSHPRGPRASQVIHDEGTD